LAINEQIHMDRANLVHHVSNVIWVMKLSRRGTEAGKIRFANPDGSHIYIETPGKELRRVDPNVRARDTEPDVLAPQYAIGASVVMPMHILAQRADLQVYASLRKADTPFSMAVYSHQDMWSPEWREAFRTSLRAVVEAKKLPPTVKVARYAQEDLQRAYDGMMEAIQDEAPNEQILDEVASQLASADKQMVTVPTIKAPVDVKFPDVVREDPLEQAQALEIQIENEMCDVTTASTLAGHDATREAAKIRARREREGEPKDGDKDDKPDNKAKLDKSPLGKKAKREVRQMVKREVSRAAEAGELRLKKE
jgi:hypothetical protein